MMYIFKAFDPISLVFSSVGHYSVKTFNFVMENYDDYLTVVLGDDPEDLEDYPDLAEREGFVSGNADLLATQKTKLIELGLDDEWVEKIVKAAAKSGEAIHRTLTTYIEEVS